MGQDAAWIDAVSIPLPITDDGFESGDFSTLAWQQGQTPWQITAADVRTGTYSARSGVVSDANTSGLSLTYEGPAGSIGFAFKVSSEDEYDFLIFRIDGQEIAAWSGERAWADVNFPVTAGTHTYNWTYEKDEEKSAGQDAAWIDDVFLPDGPAGMNFVDVPSGSFLMGNVSTNPIHFVTLRGFKMSRYETTNAQYAEYLNAALMDGVIVVFANRVYATSDTSDSQPYFDTSASTLSSQITYSNGTFSVRTRDGQSMADHPVVQVSWYGAQAFCDYYGYRLPTEAEWEYAARGGYHDPYYEYPWGSDTIDPNQATYDSNNPLGLTSWPYTSPVGRYGPQGGYGLCDMAGNVWEWCQDWYGGYPTSPAKNPTGPSEGTQRLSRSGGWASGAFVCTVAFRNTNLLDARSSDLGFRVCAPASPLH